mmetsp:Transcript_23337/g.30886  ORF Transcript_23337/g.30886 Transcript_23337/m.30886 type:complete len:208 (-) Transcript_23337:1822-2445(-)
MLGPKKDDVRGCGGKTPLPIFSLPLVPPIASPPKAPLPPLDETLAPPIEPKSKGEPEGPTTLDPLLPPVLRPPRLPIPVDNEGAALGLPIADPTAPAPTTPAPTGAEMVELMTVPPITPAPLLPSSLIGDIVGSLAEDTEGEEADEFVPAIIPPVLALLLPFLRADNFIAISRCWRATAAIDSFLCSMNAICSAGVSPFGTGIFGGK